MQEPRVFTGEASEGNRTLAAFAVKLRCVCPDEVSPCAGCLDVFHSNRKLVLALDTDPGVDPNQKQGARPVLRHMNEAYQTCKASKWLCKCLICSGDFEAYHVADGFHGLICLRANNKVMEE